MSRFITAASQKKSLPKAPLMTEDEFPSLGAEPVKKSEPVKKPEPQPEPQPEPEQKSNSGSYYAPIRSKTKMSESSNTYSAPVKDDAPTNTDASFFVDWIG